MMYQVLVVGLLSCIPAALPAATVPHTGLEFDDSSLETDAPSFRESLLGDETSLFYAVGLEATWDPLGTGCVDPADPEVWGLDGRRNPETGPLCLARPCARLLTTDELEYPILGRRLLEGEWDVYTVRYAATCSEGEQHLSAGLDVLPDLAQSWSEVARSPGAALSRGSSVGMPALSTSSGPKGPSRGSFPGASGGNPFDNESPDPVTPPGTPLQPGGADAAEPPYGSGGSTGGSNTGSGAPPPVTAPQPTPVPLPGSLAMLLAGMAALRLTRR